MSTLARALAMAVVSGFLLVGCSSEGSGPDLSIDSGARDTAVASDGAGGCAPCQVTSDCPDGQVCILPAGTPQYGGQCRQECNSAADCGRVACEPVPGSASFCACR